MKRIWLIIILLLLWTGLATAWQKPPAGTRIKPGHLDVQGLAGYWLFNEGTGNQAGDLSGNANHGTLLSPTWVPGRDGWALHFDGVTASVIIGNAVSCKVGKLTVAAWAYNDTAIGDEIADKIIDWENDSYGFQLFDANSNYTFAIKADAAVSVGSSSYPENSWFHIAGTFDGTNVRLYINGKEEASDTTSGDIDYTVLSDLRIGNRGTDARHWGGMIDRVIIYDHALSAAEVLQLYLSPYDMLQQQQVWQWFTLFARRIFLIH